MVTLEDKLMQLVMKWYLKGDTRVVAGPAPDGRTLISDAKVAVLLTAHPFNLEQLVQPNGGVVSEESVKKLLPAGELKSENRLVPTGLRCSDQGYTGIQYVDSSGETWYVDEKFVKQLMPLKNMPAMPYVASVGKGFGIVYFVEEPAGILYGFCASLNGKFKKHFDGSYVKRQGE